VCVRVCVWGWVVRVYVRVCDGVCVCVHVSLSTCVRGVVGEGEGGGRRIG
jgi:hypothetical protein